MQMRKDVYDSLTDGEKSLVKWQGHWAGGFETMLWELICKADEGNLDRLFRAFPSHVAAWNCYSRMDGWWKQLSTRLYGAVVPVKGEARDEGQD
jgi:hypothetical protein